MHSEIFLAIKKYLIENADTIQKRATKQHKELLGGDKFRSEIIEKYQDNHIKVVKQLAKNLKALNIKKNRKIFLNLGEALAKDSVRDSLTIEEATDGIIFLKQVIWETIKEQGFLKKLTTEEFYLLTQVSGTLVDIVVSKIAFAYHEHFSKLKEEQGKRKNEFIGMASHELKTPVTSVKAYAQVLQNRFTKAGDSQSATLLKKMDGQLDKLTNLIGDLLDATKIETGKLQFQKRLFDFKELVTEVVEEMQRTTNKHIIITKLGVSENIYGDRDRIGQVIVNLLANAIKYSPNADEIIVKTEDLKNEIMLSIQDFGVGISRGAQSKVFDQFFRVTDKNEKIFPGMGLGLYVSAEIIKRHQGQIWVESEKGKGSTFYFTLPVKNFSKGKDGEIT